MHDSCHFGRLDTREQRQWRACSSSGSTTERSSALIVTQAAAVTTTRVQARLNWIGEKRDPARQTIARIAIAVMLQTIDPAEDTIATNQGPTTSVQVSFLIS